MGEGVRLCTEGAIIKVLGYQPGRGACPSLALKRSRVCALDFVLCVVAHGVRLLRSGRGCGGRRGVSAHSIEFAQIVSEVRPAYQEIGRASCRERV